MKIPILLLLMATPALAQTPEVAPAPVVAEAKSVEASMPQMWEFAPDFLRDQNRISWRTDDGSEFFGTLTTGAGVLVSETIGFPDVGGKTMAMLTTKFDKSGQLQRVELRDTTQKLFMVQTEFTDRTTPIAVKGSTVSQQGVMANGMLVQRTLTLDFPIGKNTLTSDYDARGRRVTDTLADKNGQPIRTIRYLYDAKGLNAIEDGAIRSMIERDNKGRMISVSAMSNGLLQRHAAPLRDDKGNVTGTRIEDYSGGILREVNEITQEGGAPRNSRLSQSSNEKTIFENGQQSNEKKFEFRVDISPSKQPATASAEIRKRMIYRAGKVATEELFRDGQLTQRSEFNGNGVIAKLTTFNADGSVANAIDTSAIPYADGGIIRR